MNIERDSKVAFRVSYSEIVRALKLLYPEEFLLNQLPPKWESGVNMDVVTSVVTLTYNKRTQGPAEIDFNRQQRVIEPDGA
jgi:hypothetical protein